MYEGSESSVVLCLLLEELSRRGKAENCDPELKFQKTTILLI